MNPNPVSNLKTLSSVFQYNLKRSLVKCKVLKVWEIKTQQYLEGSRSRIRNKDDFRSQKWPKGNQTPSGMGFLENQCKLTSIVCFSDILFSCFFKKIEIMKGNVHHTYIFQDIASFLDATHAICDNTALVIKLTLPYNWRSNYFS